MIKNKAFTLIELLIVFAVIGLLAGIILASVKSVRDRASIAKTLQYSKSVDNLLAADAVGIWNFDDQTNPTKDTSGWANHGTVNGATFATDTPHRAAGAGAGKYSLSFDGDGDNVQISKPLGLTGPFTFSHWLKTVINAGQTYTIGNASGGDGYRFGIGVGGKIQFLIGNPGGHTETICGSTAVNDGKWHLIVGVFDRGSAFRCYVDGKSDGSVAIPFYDGMYDGAPGVGAPPCCTDFNGLIDEVRIFSRALTQTEIQKLYTEGAAGHGMALK